MLLGLDGTELVLERNGYAATMEKFLVLTCSLICKRRVHALSSVSPTRIRSAGSSDYTNTMTVSPVFELVRCIPLYSCATRHDARLLVPIGNPSESAHYSTRPSLRTGLRRTEL